MSDVHSSSTASAESEAALQEGIEFRLPSDPKVLKVVRLTISYLCEIVGFKEADIHSITLAVDEACSNIIKHAYDGDTRRPIIVSCRMLKNGLQVVLQDFGKKVDKAKIKSRRLDDIKPGGLGVHFITSIMDEVIYDDSSRDRNLLKLTKFVRET